MIQQDKDSEHIAKQQRTSSRTKRSNQVNHQLLTQLSCISPPEEESERRNTSCSTSLKKYHKRRMHQFWDLSGLMQLLQASKGYENKDAVDLFMTFCLILVLKLNWVVYNQRCHFLSCLTHLDINKKEMESWNSELKSHIPILILNPNVFKSAGGKMPFQYFRRGV